MKGEAKEERRLAYSNKGLSRIMSIQVSLYYFLYFVYI